MPRSGDLILVAGGSDWQSRVIMAGTQSHWSHVAIFMDTAGRLLVEATRKGIAFVDAAKYDGHETHAIDTRLTEEQRIAASRFASSCVGQRYSRLEIAAIMFAWASGKRWYVGTEGAEDCASLCARAMEHAGMVLPKAPALFRPRDFADLFDVTPRLGR